MLKCGQTGNKNYRFGLREEQIKEDKNINNDIKSAVKCVKCNASIEEDINYCKQCGEKVVSTT